jgi:hypothetical protein
MPIASVATVRRWFMSVHFGELMASLLSIRRPHPGWALRLEELEEQVLNRMSGALDRRPGCAHSAAAPWVQFTKEVTTMTTNAENLPERPPNGHISVAELARRQGVGPIESVDELARPGTFESDDELDEFLADLYESRRAD